MQVNKVPIKNKIELMKVAENLSFREETKEKTAEWVIYIYKEILKAVEG